MLSTCPSSFLIDLFSLTLQNVFARAVCGNSRFCSSNPVDCDPQQLGDCNAFASWKLSSDGTKLEMGLYAQTSSYVAFGFSRSPSMVSSSKFLTVFFIL